MNGEHLKILDQGIEAWNEWRSENRGFRPTSASPTSATPTSAAPTSHAPTSPWFRCRPPRPGKGLWASLGAEISERRQVTVPAGLWINPKDPVGPGLRQGELRLTAFHTARGGPFLQPPAVTWTSRPSGSSK